MSTSLEKKYKQFAESLTEQASLEIKIGNVKRANEELKKEFEKEKDGSFGIELSAHAFKQISERLEVLVLENANIYYEVFKGVKEDCVFLPSNLNAFVISLIAKAREKGCFVKEKSKNSQDGYEYRYTYDITEWSVERPMQFICIVENNNIKTGFFNFS